MFLLKDHNTVVPVRLEPAALRSRVKHSTTEPLRSPDQRCALDPLCEWKRVYFDQLASSDESKEGSEFWKLCAK